MGGLLGGCLTMLAATVGTGFLPDFRDSILVLEDIDEPEYRIDRLLTQLRTSRRMAGVRAVVAGHFTNCDARDSLIDFADALGGAASGRFAGGPRGAQSHAATGRPGPARSGCRHARGDRLKAVPGHGGA